MQLTGMFLNMVMPTAKVVQMFDPSHRPQASTCTRAATFRGTNSVERAAMMTAAPTQASLTCSTGGTVKQSAGTSICMLYCPQALPQKSAWVNSAPHSQCCLAMAGHTTACRSLPYA